MGSNVPRFLSPRCDRWPFTVWVVQQCQHTKGPKMFAWRKEKMGTQISACTTPSRSTPPSAPPPHFIIFRLLTPPPPPRAQAKTAAVQQGKWLLVNMLGSKCFQSQQLNRDTWANDSVQATVVPFFVFWQVLAPPPSKEGLKINHLSSELLSVMFVFPREFARSPHTHTSLWVPLSIPPPSAQGWGLGWMSPRYAGTKPTPIFAV